MEKTQLKRQQLIDKMADHLLAHGFQDFTLRSLGAATGTSDRMLLHYFADKSDLLTATLTLITERMLTNLRSLRTAPMAQHELIVFLAGLLNSPAVLPYTNLWLELTAVAIREGDPYRTVAAQIMDAYREWVDASLKTDWSTNRDEAIAFVLAYVEGLVVLNAVGKDAEVRRALAWARRG